MSRIMSWRRNEVLIEWMDRSSKGETNRVNVKHILVDAEDITVGAVVTAHINSRRYKGEVKGLLEWSAPMKMKRKRKNAEKTSEVSAENSGTEKKAGTQAKTRTSAEKSTKKAGKREEKGKVYTQKCRLV